MLIGYQTRLGGRIHRLRLRSATALAVAALVVAGCTSESEPAQPSVSSPTPSATPNPTPTSPPAPLPSPTGPVHPQVVATVASGLRSPWGLAFLPDGSALVSERDIGKIVRIPRGGGQPTTLGTVPGVRHGGEGGLLGIAVAPTFARDRWLYAYFTASDGNRVVRIKLAADVGLGAPQPLLTGIPAGPIHNGGRLAFGPDGMLYVSTGDASTRSHSQDRNSLGGKILRLTPDGEPAPGNPFPGSPVWSYGHRNVQGMAWDGRGRMWAGEFGQNTWDELNLIRPGANYGWPVVEGKADRSGFVDPLMQWPTDQASPSGIAAAGGSVWLAALRGARLWQVPLTATGVGTPKAWFAGEFGRLRTVALAPDGTLWLATSNTDGRGSPRAGDDRILRVALRPG